MIGSLFSGTDESPGEYFIENGAAYKIYRGLSSCDASIDNIQSCVDREPEGVSARITYKGKLKKH